MLCDKCERLLDLDTSFPTGSGVDGGPCVAHHESYSALCRASRAGCELCQLVVQNCRVGTQDMQWTTVIDPKWQISAEFSPESINFNIPIRIDYGEAEQSFSEESYEIGEDNIKLGIAVEYSKLTTLIDVLAT